MGRPLHRSLLRVALLAALAVAGLTPRAQAQSTSYKLLDNASVTGPAFFPQSGNYQLHLNGTFGGATLSLVMTQNSGGATKTLGTWTSAPGTDPCIVIPAGVQLQMTVASGSPASLYANLGGVGSGGCPVTGTGIDPVGVKNVAGDPINPATTTTDTNTSTLANAAANPGSDGSKALSIQGVTGGKALKTDGSATYSTTDKGGTITTGGTAQSAIASNASRKSYCIQNDPAATEILSVRLNGTASATAGTILVPGKQACSVPGVLDTSAVSVFAATTGHRFFGYEGQ